MEYLKEGLSEKQLKQIVAGGEGGCPEAQCGAVACGSNCPSDCITYCADYVICQRDCVIDMNP